MAEPYTGQEWQWWNDSTDAQRFRAWCEANSATAALRERVAAIIGWLEREQPDVFRRGLWDAISAAGGTSASAGAVPFSKCDACPSHMEAACAEFSRCGLGAFQRQGTGHKADCPKEAARIDGRDRWYMMTCDCTGLSGGDVP